MQTLGMQAIDWRITDKEISPPGTENFYTEKLLRISSHYPFQPPVNMSVAPPLPARTNGYITMVCLNDNRKITDKSLKIWSKILHHNPGVGLIIISAEQKNEYAEQSIRPRLRVFNLPDDRVSIIPRLNFQSYLNLSAIADFALDTTPISGGTTTLLGISVGIPTLCLDRLGLGPLSTLSAALMRHVGLGECNARNEEEYLQKASSWIGNLALIEQLRNRCLTGLKSSLLLNHKAITQELENAYIQCFKQAI